MRDDLGTFRNGIYRFRSGGIAIAALPLVLGIALLLAGERMPALLMIAVSVILMFLILWATHCMEDAVGKLKAERRDGA
jgi:hypothetical protein